MFPGGIRWEHWLEICLTLSWRRSLLYTNWFLYVRDIRHERFNYVRFSYFRYFKVCSVMPVVIVLFKDSLMLHFDFFNLLFSIMLHWAPLRFLYCLISFLGLGYYHNTVCVKFLWSTIIFRSWTEVFEKVIFLELFQVEPCN